MARRTEITLNQCRGTGHVGADDRLPALPFERSVVAPPMVQRRPFLNYGLEVSLRGAEIALDEALEDSWHHDPQHSDRNGAHRSKFTTSQDAARDVLLAVRLQRGSMLIAATELAQTGHLH